MTIWAPSPIKRLVVRDLPLTVAIDTLGNDFLP